jgi:hypothetical protein
MAATLFRGYILPPPPSSVSFVTKKYYFDAGASNWLQGAGGPSLSYFVAIWQRHGFEFDHIFAFEMTTSLEQFYNSVPLTYKSRTVYQQAAVSSQPEQDSAQTPFLPKFIERTTRESDYVLFKLDIDSPTVEDGQIEYILKNRVHIDELFWEHHVAGNYLMDEYWNNTPGNPPSNLSLRQSYELFLRMRKQGIRAHSWV